MSSHRFTIDSTPGLVASFLDVACSCGWKFTTLSGKAVAVAHAEEHLEREAADTEAYDALCDL